MMEAFANLLPGTPRLAFRTLHRFSSPGTYYTSTTIHVNIALPTGTTVSMYAYGIHVPVACVVQSLLVSSGGTAPTGTSLIGKVGLYEVDPVTVAPTLAIGATNQAFTLPTGTYGRRRLILPSPIVIDRPRNIRVCTVYDVGSAGNISGGTMLGTTNSYLLPSAMPTSAGIGDMQIDASGLTFAAGLPLDFRTLAGATYTAYSGGNNPANIDWVLGLDA